MSTSSDCRKVNMAAGECFQQLTRSLTSTARVQAAARSAESMAGQNLPGRDQQGLSCRAGAVALERHVRPFKVNVMRASQAEEVTAG